VYIGAACVAVAGEKRTELEQVNAVALGRMGAETFFELEVVEKVLDNYAVFHNLSAFILNKKLRAPWEASRSLVIV
jgi:hypothetical protein